MKSFSGFVPDDRRAWHRKEMVGLLGGREDLFERIEQAENDYRFFVSGVASSVESDRAIHDDLDAMVEAIEVLQSLYNPGGSAKALFEGEAFRLVGGPKLQAMRDLFQGVPGEGLVMAACAALEKHQVRVGRPADTLKIERQRLVANVAHIAEEAGITVKRLDRSGGDNQFVVLLSHIFDRVEIENDSLSFVDSAIREHLESRSE